MFCSPWGRKELDTTERLNNTIGDLGFPKWLSSKESACQRRRLGFDPWDPLEKEMAPHSSILACRIPWTEEPHRLQSMGLHRVGHDRNNLEGIHAQIIS